jgi:hypothetical protein
MVHPEESPAERCTWCGHAVEPDDGFRLEQRPGERHAVFCRLEHVVPWSMQGARFEAAGGRELVGHDDMPARCAHCGDPLGDSNLVLVRHRGEHRIPDAFCSVEHLAEWAKAGGRWR